jgi:hypothetical protein
MTGRKCPKVNCGGFFKIKLGTGVQEPMPCHCPYCGFSDKHSEFATEDQLEYAKSIAMNKISNALAKDIKAWNQDLRSKSRNSIISLEANFKPKKHPIHYYREEELETLIVCKQCTLVYSIFGIFSYCPDCGDHNSLQILQKNMELIEKELNYANSSEDKELKVKLIEDSLENCVSAFDAFGRETIKVYSKGKVDISFQTIHTVKDTIEEKFGINISHPLNPIEWQFVIKLFQKRHLFSHKLGIVDSKYLKITNDPDTMLNRKVPLQQSEVEELINLILRIGDYLVEKFKSKNK